MSPTPAKMMAILKSLLSQYIYGVKTPSPERMEAIRATLRELGEHLIAV